MKNKFLIIIIMIVVVVAIALFLPENKEYDYLRLHIRANSNSTVDQNVKYKIKDSLVEFLTPYFSTLSSKDEAIETARALSDRMEDICSEIPSHLFFCILS